MGTVRRDGSHFFFVPSLQVEGDFNDDHDYDLFVHRDTETQRDDYDYDNDYDLDKSLSVALRLFKRPSGWLSVASQLVKCCYAAVKSNTRTQNYIPSVRDTFLMFTKVRSQNLSA